MTTTTQAPPIPEELHEEATDLVRDLAAIAGDRAAVTVAIQASLGQAKNKDREAALALIAAALIVVFSECITTPTEPGAHAETSLPTH